MKKNLFKNTIVVIGFILTNGLFVNCSDYLEKSPRSQYLSTEFYNNEGAIKQGSVGCYQLLSMGHNNPASYKIPLSILWDMYTPYGIERADNNSIGVGNLDLRTHFTLEYIWATLYSSIARCNTVLDGSRPYINNLSAQAKIYLEEIKVLRAHFYIQLISLWGDVPYFKSSVTEQEQKNAFRKPWMEIVDDLIIELTKAAEVLPWQTNQWGRVDKSVALGLKARIALYAGSWCKFGFGKDAVRNPDKAQSYFKVAAESANKVITEGGRCLAYNYKDLFTRAGQMKPDVKKESMLFMMFSDFGNKNYHYMSLGEQSRIIGQSGRFPTQQLVDTYEMRNGKRIDQDGSGYDPKHPFDNRDPRLKETIYTQHDTIIGNTGKNKLKFLMELFNPQTKSWDEKGNSRMIANLDYSGSVAQYGYVFSGVGYAWKKYNHFDDEASALPTYNIHIMRYAEILLTYAEAKIELNELSDGTAVKAIDEVRTRVKMPNILSVDPSRALSQIKMRQIVRRERKVELAKESLMLFDMRRWRTGQIQNSEPTYGYPKAIGVDPKNNIYPDGYEQATADMVPTYGEVGSERDINDIPSYKLFANKLRTRDKDRHWEDKFYVWPIPQTERNKCKNLKQNPGYGE